MSSRPSDRITISLFNPQPATLRREVGVIRIVLGLWGVLAFGVPLLIWLFGLGDPSGLGASWLTSNRSFFGFPLHYWLIAQGCTLGFVGLCKLYCDLWSRRVRSAAPTWAPHPDQEQKHV